MGLAFEGAYVAYPAILGRDWGDAIVGAGTFVYSTLRAVPVFGPRHFRAKSPEAFLPDKVVVAILAVIDVGTTISFILRPPPGEEVNAIYVLWFLLSISRILWFQMAAFRSRGWGIGLGLMFIAMGFFIQLDQPEQRLQRVEAVVGFLYFGSRFAGLGPRPKGFLGIDSESGD